MNTNSSTPKYPCTECGKCAFFGYTSGKKKDAWGGLVKRGERVCALCFIRRGGEDFMKPIRGKKL